METRRCVRLRQLGAFPSLGRGLFESRLVAGIGWFVCVCNSHLVPAHGVMEVAMCGVVLVEDSPRRSRPLAGNSNAIVLKAWAIDIWDSRAAWRTAPLENVLWMFMFSDHGESNVCQTMFQHIDLRCVQYSDTLSIIHELECDTARAVCTLCRFPAMKSASPPFVCLALRPSYFARYTETFTFVVNKLPRTRSPAVAAGWNKPDCSPVR